VFAFGSEELENKYSHELTNLGLKTHDLDEPGEEDVDESQEITKLGKLDSVLEKCIEMIRRGYETDPDKYGRVAACLIDNKNNHTYGINLPGPDGTRLHAERVAIDNHLKRHGRIGPNAIMVTTLSPCVHDMDERHGESCTDLLTDYGIEKCYAGWQDPTQHPVTDYPFNLQVTDDTDIFNSCIDIAASFLPGAMIEGNFTRLQNKERPAMRFNKFKLTENSKVTIKRVQQVLLDLGYNLGPTGVDGMVGPYTQSAIDAYMSKAGPQGQVVPKKDKPSTTPVAPKKDKPSTTPVAPKKDKPSTSSTMPVNGRLTSAFGNRKAPVPGTGTGHPGVDIAVPTGTAVRSPIAGKVEYASMDNNACGGTIAISNGREKHRFCHCSKIDVTVGQVIQQGDVIGLTGGGARDPGRGLSTGPHLHWEKYIAGNLVDPMSNIG
jgi:pyrimidine deaminase RibD-like protein/peptidoglycan hydrolase-like protein with peptidoglycan-binding domain